VFFIAQILLYIYLNSGFASCGDVCRFIKFIKIAAFFNFSIIAKQQHENY
jgi:hypothetical protein